MTNRPCLIKSKISRRQRTNKHHFAASYRYHLDVSRRYRSEGHSSNPTEQNSQRK
jgi:hypothetical protein